MLLQPTATILDRLQVNQLVAAKQQPMVEAGPGQTAEVSGARDDRKLFVGMLSKGQVRVIIKVVMMMIMMIMMHASLKLTKIVFPTRASCHRTLLMCSSDNFMKLNQ